MKTKLLFPNKCKVIGLILIVIGLAVGLIFNEMLEDYLRLDIGFLGDDLFGKETDMTYTISSTFLLIGGMMTAFSREKIEDEFVVNLRLKSWMWAIIINYVLLFIAILFVYGLNFIDIMVYNMFTPLIIYIIYFNFVFYKDQHQKENEE